MALWNRGSHRWLDDAVNGQRHRELLSVSDVRQARRLERHRIIEFSKRRRDPARRRKRFGALTITEAIAEYIEERRGQVSTRHAWAVTPAGAPLR